MKGQLQTLEPIIVLLAIAILAGFAVFFFARAGEHQIVAQSAIAGERDALNLLKRITGLPELRCPASEAGDTYCIDRVKAEVFSTAMRDPRSRLQYSDILGEVSIDLDLVHLELPTEHLVLYDALLPDADVLASTTYFTVYDPTTKDRVFAVMTIRRPA